MFGSREENFCSERMAESNQFFPSIGSVVDKAGFHDGESPSVSDADLPLQEIESLCMQCRQQVRVGSFLAMCLCVMG
jgi:hypothetical protein